MKAVNSDKTFKILAKEWLAPEGAVAPGPYGVSYWNANRPSRFFGSREQMEVSRLEFIRLRGRGLNLIRLARETKYYVDGRNVPNRL